MNEKCKYCDYVSECSRFCEYNSIMCLIHRSFPKIVDKTYEELEKQNQELKQLIKENTVLVEDENGNYQELNINPLKIQQENQELKKQLGEQQYYKFYKYDNNPDGSDYCYCERPCDDNMSLRCFLKNGEILGFMSETLASAYDNIKEITMSDFMFEFVKPLIKENYIMRAQQKEFIEWLEKNINHYKEIIKSDRENNTKQDCRRFETRWTTYEESLSKYKEIIGVKDEK